MENQFQFHSKRKKVNVSSKPTSKSRIPQVNKLKLQNLLEESKAQRQSNIKSHRLTTSAKQIMPRKFSGSQLDTQIISSLNTYHKKIEKSLQKKDQLKEKIESKHKAIFNFNFLKGRDTGQPKKKSSPLLNFPLTSHRSLNYDLYYLRKPKESKESSKFENELYARNKSLNLIMKENIKVLAPTPCNSPV